MFAFSAQTAVETTPSPIPSVPHVTNFRMEVTERWAQVDWVLSDGRQFCLAAMRGFDPDSGPVIGLLYSAYRTRLARLGVIPEPNGVPQ